MYVLPWSLTTLMSCFWSVSKRILQDEIPDVTIPYADDVPVKGPRTRYELPGGGYETIDGNPGIRRFVWEHLADVVQILQRIKAVDGTVSAKKLQICAPRGIVVGHECMYVG